MSDYPHLKLPIKIDGNIKPPLGRYSLQPSEQTTKNSTERRQQHGEYLGNTASRLVDYWIGLRKTREAEGIRLPNETDIPVFLRIDTDVFDIDSLKNWGIEIISEEENGYIIGASFDNLESFKKNVTQFLTQEGRYKNTAAKIWEIATDDSWRFTELIKGELGSIWGDIVEDVLYVIQVGVACSVPQQKKYPIRSGYDSESKFQVELTEYKSQEKANQVERDKKQILREKEIEIYIEIFGGEIHEIWDNEVDAIYFKISISGKGLKELVLTYQYLYEVKLDSKFSLENIKSTLSDDYELEIIAPENDSPKVCVIDSGIQEHHRLIKPAIDETNSRSYLDDDTSTADYVRLSGHGTKVAGVILYPEAIPKRGQNKLESIIQNARILNKNNSIDTSRFEPKLMEQIVEDYNDTRIFNLSVSENIAYTGTHMPSLAASLDKLMYEKDILFIVAAGNLDLSSSGTQNLGILEFLRLGKNYPTYLNESTSKIASPGVSYFSITVGSIARVDFENDDYKVIAGYNNISPFSRTGMGMWGCIKPDVVEFGGDLIKNKLSDELKTHEITSPELVNSTLYGASAIGKDSVGTSFSTPKVSYIASRLQSEHPSETAQMYRALIIQSARLPDHCFHNPSSSDFEHYGYGIPNVDRALNNSPSRITFIQDGRIGPKKADIYRLKIPDSIKGEGKDFRILVEVTLSFTSKTRLTRKGSHSYMANWIEWQSSKYNESFTSFRNRTIEYIENDQADDNTIEDVADSIKWVIRENPSWSNNGINRNKSAVQKSWTIIEPHQFADEFSLAVIGHFGWNRSLESETPYALCVSFEILNAELNIYELLAEAQIEFETEQEIEV